MNRGGAWDDSIDRKLTTLYGAEKFNAQEVQLSFDDKKKLFKPLIEKLQSRNIKIITVAGTNGKGETSRLIQSHLMNDKLATGGAKVGLWTSPHILSVRERFQINNSLIPKEIFEKLLLKVEKLKLSYYETLFMIFCEWMTTQEELNYIVLEVGLGGRLDATNFFDTNLACLTSISRDHCDILGNSLVEILGEKLGVCRTGVPLISSVSGHLLQHFIEGFSQERKIPLHDLSETLSNLKELPYWKQNMITSLAAYQIVTRGTLNTESLKPEFLPAPQVSPGRFEQMTLKNRRFIFIGAHNLDGLRQLVQSVFERLSKDQEVDTLMALSDRPVEEVSSMIDVILSCSRLKENAMLSVFDHPRALPSKKLFSLMELRERKGKENIRFAKDWFEQIQNSKTETTLVLGSYYFIAEVQKFIISNATTF